MSALFALYVFLMVLGVLFWMFIIFGIGFTIFDQLKTEKEKVKDFKDKELQEEKEVFEIMKQKTFEDKINSIKQKDKAKEIYL